MRRTRAAMQSVLSAVLMGGLMLGSTVHQAYSEQAQQGGEAKVEVPALPGIEIDREKGHVDLEAEVVNGEAQWLELLVCSPNSREYESVLTSVARPSHIHLALLLLGVEPGAPLSWRKVEADADADADADANDDAGTDGDAGVTGMQFVVEPPRGQVIEVYCIWEDEQGQRHRVAANEWVKNQLTDEPMKENTWLFTGSVFHRMEAPPLPQGAEDADEVPERARQVYMADLNGTIISLVNFGDDLITRPTTTTNRNDEQAWATRSEVIPPAGTSVTLRLVPTDKRSDGAEPPERGHVPDVPFTPPQQGMEGD